MGYFDDDYEEYYEYEDRLEPVEIVSESFSESLITEKLLSAGLVSDSAPRFSGSMEKLVFVYGDDKEVYSTSEIRFIEQIDKVFVYSDFAKTLKKYTMPCRIIATRIDNSGHDAITDCVSFEKIINKAFDGFNIFFFVTVESVYFGCRLFDKGNYDCTLSNPIMEEEQFEQVLEAFLYTAESEDFLDYYQQIKHVISIGQEEYLGYEDSVVSKKGASYLDALDDISRALGVDVSGAKCRYWNDFYGEQEPSFSSILDEVCEDLSFIQSKRINIYEMLFEADEAMRQAEAAEAANQAIRDSFDIDIYERSYYDEEAQSLLDDPEEMIKLLKKRRGI